MKTTLLALLFLPLLAVGQSTIAKEGGPTDVYYNRGDRMAPLSLKLLEERRAFVPEVNRAAFDVELQSIRHNSRGVTPLILGAVLMASSGSIFLVNELDENWKNAIFGAGTGGGAIAFQVGIHRLSHKREARRRATWLYYETYVWQ